MHRPRSAALPASLATALILTAAPPALAAGPSLRAAAGTPAYDPSTVLVQPSGRRGLHAAVTQPGVPGTVATLPGGTRLLRVTADPAQVAARLRRARGVKWAEPNYELHATASAAAPDDPLVPQMWDLAKIGAVNGWSAGGLGAFPGTGGAPVGIVDTGIDQTHPDLAGKVSACGSSSGGVVADGACADDNEHGTHVAGTIGAVANNATGIAGVAFDAPLIVCKALGGSEGSGTVADVAACVRWAHAKGAKVISLSLGGPASRTLAAATKAAWDGGAKAGSVIVAAAGNDGDGEIEFPAGSPEVVSVAASDQSDAIASFSNENADVEIAAPGVDILSTKLGGGYFTLSGTSMATPHVSGAASLIWATHPSLTAAGVRARLDAATDDLGAPGRDPAYGFGRLDLEKALGS